MSNTPRRWGEGVCNLCGADIGPSESHPWHYIGEDCRAVRAPVPYADVEHLDDEDDTALVEQHQEYQGLTE